jgi:tRNA-specific 2-thiouridylase
MSKKVALAISGGIDSSVSAYLLKKLGYEVIGLHFSFWKWGEETADEIDQRMKNIKDIQDGIGIPIRTIDKRENFKKQIIKHLITEVTSGRTPNPCILCNPQIKFKSLIEYADKNSIAYISTGHYARIEDRNGYFSIRMGADDKKDQSYVLCYLNQKILRRTIFPLGDYHKKEVIKIGKDLGLKVVGSGESQDLCFVNKDHYKNFISDFVSNADRPGDIVNISGEIIGQHRGLAFFTIGQRKGIKIASKRPYYVAGIDIEKNQLVVGYKDEIGRSDMVVINTNWIHKEPETPFECEVKIRYHAPSIGCSIEKRSSNSYCVKLEESLPDISPGQYAVFYSGDELLGGGMISC